MERVCTLKFEQNNIYPKSSFELSAEFQDN